MAIKGKGRTKARQPVRAPRRGPVPVPLPFFRRRGVQLVAAFLVGALVFWGGVWLTNGLRAENTSERDREQELLQRRTGGAWEKLVSTQVGTIGQIQAGQPPVILPQVRSVFTVLAKKTPEGAASALQTAAKDAEAAIDAIEKYQLSSSLSDKGFREGEVLRFLSARDELVTSIQLYREAALLGVLAAELEGKDRETAIARGQGLLTLADAAVLRFQTHQTEALAAAGIIRQPTIPGA
jgi:hypothetical protein